jgi:acetyl-CoA carboxylase carboxyltransferase component
MDGLVPDDAANNVSMDMRAVIARVVDASVLHEFKPEFGATVMTGE